MAGLLSGITVLEVADEFGEWTGRLLADFGARVIKVEPPAGNSTRSIGPFYGDKPDPEKSLHFWQYNAGKEGITLDLNTDRGRQVFLQLVRLSDVLIVTLPPERLEEWGLGYEALAKSNPRLVVASITPFGQTGPHKDWRATDLTLMAMGGPMNACGYDDKDVPPICPSGGHSYHTGGHYAVIGILIALVQRRSTGRGQHIDVPIQACLAVATEGTALNWLYAKRLVHRQPGQHATPSPTSPIQFICGDGRYVNLHSVREEAAWRNLVGWLTEDGIVDDLSDEKYLEPLVRQQAGWHISEILALLCARHTGNEIFHRSQALGLPYGLVQRPEEWLDDPHAAAREFFVDVEHPDIGRTLRYPGPPFKFSNAEVTIRHSAPSLGEHNVSVFSELGLKDVDLDDLRTRGVISP